LLIGRAKLRFAVFIDDVAEFVMAFPFFDYFAVIHSTRG